MNTIVFVKCSDIAIAVLDTILKFSDISHVVYPKNRKNESVKLNDFIEEHQISEIMLPFRNNVEEVNRFSTIIQHAHPDLLLVYGFSQIIAPEIFNIPDLGTVNVHGALLPDYRGANILNWQIINGETESGVTLHYIDEGVDTGDIIAQSKYPIEFTDTIVDLKRKMIHGSLVLLVGELPKIFNNTNMRKKQNDENSRHYPPRKPKDGEFLWKWPAHRIYNMIRGLVHPWPGAYYYTENGEKVVIDYYIPFPDIIKIQNEKIFKRSSELYSYVQKGFSSPKPLESDGIQQDQR